MTRIIWEFIKEKVRVRRRAAAAAALVSVSLGPTLSDLPIFISQTNTWTRGEEEEEEGLSLR